jgi:alanine racemase
LTSATASRSAPAAAAAAAAAAGARACAVLTVDLDAVVDNWRRLRARAAPSHTAAVVKADAYGLGAARVAPALAAAGCTTFFVASLDEGLALRRVVPAASAIFSLGGLPDGTQADMVAGAIVPVLNQPGEIARWRAAARSHGKALAAAIHIDTGMNRLGLTAPELAALAADARGLEGLDIRLWVSHFACAEDRAAAMNAAQIDCFRRALAILPPAPASLANSSGIFLGAAAVFDMVRPGCGLYGINPTPDAVNPMRCAVRLDARVLQVRDVDSPQSVGYGASHRVVGRAKIATVAVGYADGYPRALSGRGQVVVAGVAVPVVGRVSMDLLTVDVTGLPDGAVAPDDWVQVLGPERTADAVAAEAGTIGYEILTSLGRRYHRVYVGAGEERAS